jgi:ATP-dependent DNA ligase
VKLFSRQKKSLNTQFPSILEGLAELSAETVVDGELVAIDDSGRTDFNLLQNFRSESARIHYYVFDLLCCKGRDLTRLPLIAASALEVLRRDSRQEKPGFRTTEAAPIDLVSAASEQGLEGVIGKRKGSLYQPGKRSGAWIKYRVNRGQELVIGGYVPGTHGLDSTPDIRSLSDFATTKTPAA